MPDLPFSLPTALPATALDPRILVGIVGVLLALAGARFYRVALLAPAFVLGIFIAMILGESLDPPVQLGVAVACGVVAAGALHFLERAAVALAGAFLFGALAHAFAPLVMAEPQWWVPTLAAAVGLVLFRFVYERMLPLITSLLGGLCIAWAAGSPDDLRIIAGVTVVGSVIQSVMKRKKKDPDA